MSKISKAFCQVDNIALQWFMQEQSRKRDCKKKTEIIIFFIYIYSNAFMNLQAIITSSNK